MSISSEEYFKDAILEAMLEIVFLYDIPTGKLIYINNQIKSILGYDPEEIINKKTSVLSDLIHPEDAKVTHAYFEKQIYHKEELKDLEEIKIRNSAGVYHWFKISTKILKRFEDGSKHQLLGIATNIDKQKTAEFQKSKLTEKYNKTFGIKTLSMFLLNEATDTFVEISAGFLKTSGYDTSELLGQSIHDHPICRANQLWKEIKRSLLQKGYVSGIELMLTTKDGKVIPCLFSGELIELSGIKHIIATTTNISRIKEYENQITAYRELSKSNEERLSISIKAAKQGFFDLNMISGHAITNDEYALMLDYNPSEFKESNEFWVERLHADERDEVISKYKLCQTGESEEFDEIFRQKTKSGRYIWVHCLGKVVAYNKSGQGLRMVGLHMNISEQKITEEKLMRSLQDSERNEANIRTIIENTTSSIWAINNKYEIIFVNSVFRSEFLQSFGIDLQIGVNLPNQLPAFLREIWMTRYNRALAGEHFSFEDAVRINKHKTIYIEVFVHPIVSQNQILGASFFAQNISERKLQELEILKAKNSAEENEQKFRAFSTQSSEGITVATLNGNYVFVNHAFCKMTGYSEDELLNMNVKNLKASQNRENIFNDSITEKAVTPIQVEIVRKDKSVFLAEVIGKRISIAGEELALGTIRDISKQEIETKFKNNQIKLYEIADKLENDEIADYAVNALMDLTSSTDILVYNFDEITQTLKLESKKSKLSAEAQLKSSFIQFPIMSAGIYIEALLTRNAIIYNNYADNSNSQNQFFSNREIEKMLAVPVLDSEYSNSLILLMNKSSDYIPDEIRNIKTYLQNIWNIIRRKNAEEKNQILQNAIENSSASVIITDVNGNIEYANQAFGEISGYKEAEYLGKNVNLVNSEFQGKNFYPDLWTTVKSGKTWTGEFKNKRKNGECYWEQAIISPVFNKQQQIKHFVAIKTNISDLKKMSIELLEAKEKAEINEYKVRSMFENSLSGFLFFTPEGEILEANAAVLKIIGSPSFEMTKKINLLHFKPLQDVGFSENIIKCVTSKEIVSADAQYTSKWGITVFMKYFLVPIITDNNVTGIWANLQDLTDLWKTQQELIGALEKAKESDRLKSAFLRNVSHEVRTPMNAILGISNLLVKPNLSPGQITEYRNIIHQSTLRLLEVIENMITIAHLETNQINLQRGDINPFRLVNELCEEYTELKAKHNKQHLELQVSIPPERDFVFHGDLMRLRQIMKNLLDNAIKFTFAGYIRLGFILNGTHIEFFVEDSGMGIPPDKQDTIFKSFTQADEIIMQNHGGTGVGLSIVYGLIKLMNGNLSLVSELEKGTKISFDLPIQITQKVANKQIATPSNEIAKVLVVEDEEYNFLYIREILSELPIKIIHAQNGKEALEYTENSAFDIILMDIKMPVMDGFEATSKIRKFNQTVPIIAQTAYSFKREECINGGFSDYITKPINQDQLTSIVKRYTNL